MSTSLTPTAAASSTLDVQSSTAPTGHPPGLFLLFVVEMWERFSFYGMKAFLTLYMTAAVMSGGMGWSKVKAGQMYGWYSGLVYLTPVFGGLLAGRYLGTHWSMVIGGAIIALGHFTLAAEQTWSFYAGLGLIILGTGFFKPCVSVMVGQLYKPGDPRRDGAFSIFYMGINLGAFIGPLVCGGLRVGHKHGEVFGWSWAFGAAGVGMVLGLVAYLIGRPFLLRGIGDPPKRDRIQDQRNDTSIEQVCAKCSYPVTEPERTSICPECGVNLNEHKPVNPNSKEIANGIIAIFILAFFSFFFFTAFEQAGSSLTLFAEDRTNRAIAPEWASTLQAWGTVEGKPLPSWVFIVCGLALVVGYFALRRRVANAGLPVRLVTKLAGLAAGPVLFVFGAMKVFGFWKDFFPEDFLTKSEYPADWFQSINPFFILAFAPVFSWLWLKLARANKDPSTPVKMAFGLIFLGVGFVVMVLGAQASEQGASIVQVSAWYLVAAYCIQTVGELCLSPIGLSLVTKLSPIKLAPLLMGVWFLANFASNKLAGWLAGSVDDIARHSLTIGSIMLKGQALFFSVFVLAPIAAGVVLLLLSRPLTKLIAGRA